MPLRVLLTCKYLPPEAEGGGALTVHALALALADEGVDVTILKARAESRPDPDAWAGLKVVETEYRDRFDERGSGSRQVLHTLAYQYLLCHESPQYHSHQTAGHSW